MNRRNNLTNRKANTERAIHLSQDDRIQAENKLFSPKPESNLKTCAFLKTCANFPIDQNKRGSCTSRNYSNPFHTLQVGDLLHDKETVAFQNIKINTIDGSKCSEIAEDDDDSILSQKLAINIQTRRKSISSAVGKSRRSLAFGLSRKQTTNEANFNSNFVNKCDVSAGKPKRKRILMKSLLQVNDLTARGIKADHNIFESSEIATNVSARDAFKVNQKDLLKLKLNQLLNCRDANKISLTSFKEAESVNNSNTKNGDMSITPSLITIQNKPERTKRSIKKSQIKNDFTLPRRSKDQKEKMPVACMIPNTKKLNELKQKRFRLFST